MFRRLVPLTGQHAVTATVYPFVTIQLVFSTPSGKPAETRDAIGSQKAMYYEKDEMLIADFPDPPLEPEGGWRPCCVDRAARASGGWWPLLASPGVPPCRPAASTDSNGPRPDNSITSSTVKLLEQEEGAPCYKTISSPIKRLRTRETCLFQKLQLFPSTASP